MELNKKEIVLPEVPHYGILGGKMFDTRGNRIFKEIGQTRWSTMWEVVCNEWADFVDEYEANPGDFYAAWHYLDHHPAFWGFRHGPTDIKPYSLKRRLHVKHLIEEDGIRRCVDILVVKVNSETRSTEDGEPMETEVWVELGKQSWPKEINPKDPNTFDAKFHDYLLDTGGPTVEAAICRAAHNVWTVYGNDRRVCDAPHDKEQYKGLASDEAFEQLMRGIGDDGIVNAGLRRADEQLNKIAEEATGSNEPRRKKDKEG